MSIKKRNKVTIELPDKEYEKAKKMVQKNETLSTYIKNIIMMSLRNKSVLKRKIIETEYGFSRECPRCKEEKPESEFYMDRNGMVSYHCKECAKAISKERYDLLHK